MTISFFLWYYADMKGDGIMFLHILKRDLKRKKTMNCIILLFVILSAMFFSSSVNNILSVMGGVDRFLDMAGMKDYVAVMNEPEGKEPLGKRLDGCIQPGNGNRLQCRYGASERQADRIIREYRTDCSRRRYVCDLL